MPAPRMMIFFGATEAETRGRRTSDAPIANALCWIKVRRVIDMSAPRKRGRDNRAIAETCGGLSKFHHCDWRRIPIFGACRLEGAFSLRRARESGRAAALQNAAVCQRVSTIRVSGWIKESGRL